MFRITLVLFHLPDSIRTIVGFLDRPVSKLLQHVNQQFAVDLVVFGDKDLERVALGEAAVELVALAVPSRAVVGRFAAAG